MPYRVGGECISGLRPPHIAHACLIRADRRHTAELVIANFGYLGRLSGLCLSRLIPALAVFRVLLGAQGLGHGLVAPFRQRQRFWEPVSVP